MLPMPFTMPIAADRFAGGRGMALATHTAVRAKPSRELAIEQQQRDSKYQSSLRPLGT